MAAKKPTAYALLVGSRLKTARLAAKMTPKDLASALKLRSVATITEYEKGRTVPSTNALMMAAKVLNVRPGWLLGESFDTAEQKEPLPYSAMNIPDYTPQKAGHSRPFSAAAIERSRERTLERGRRSLGEPAPTPRRKRTGG